MLAALVGVDVLRGSEIEAMMTASLQKLICVFLFNPCILLLGENLWC